MKKISTALLLAVQYLESRMQEDEQDDDVSALEAIAAELQEASQEEKDQLRAAATELGVETLLSDLGV